MANLTAARNEFLDFCDNAEILEHLQKVCQKKGVVISDQLEDCRKLYEEGEIEFQEKVHAGVQTELLPDNIWLLIVKDMRNKIPRDDLQFEHLDMVIEFDEDNNLGVKYIVNEEESIEDWVERHPEIEIDSIRGVLDSYLLEFFESENLELYNNKLYRKGETKSLTYQSYVQNEDLKSSKKLIDNIRQSGLTKNVEVRFDSLAKPGMRPESQAPLV